MHVSGFIEPRQCERLRLGLEGLTTVVAPTRIGRVDQRADLRVLKSSEWERLPDLIALRTKLTDHLDVLGEPTLREWSPNEATLMRYQARGDGIAQHLDQRCYKTLIAVISVSGRARFRLVADRAGTNVIRSWTCRPGDLVLLRAPGYRRREAERPLHDVAAIGAEPRVSLTFRMAVCER